MSESSLEGRGVAAATAWADVSGGRLHGAGRHVFSVSI